TPAPTSAGNHWSYPSNEDAGMIIDTHTHVSSPDTERYPFKPGDFPTSKWWMKDATVEHLLGVITAAGVERAVLVQGIGAYGYDNRYAVHAAANDPERLRVVVAVDMDGPDPTADLRAVAAGGTIHGVRPF